MRRYLALGLTLASLLAPVQSIALPETTQPKIKKVERPAYETNKEKALRKIKEPESFDSFLEGHLEYFLYSIIEKDINQSEDRYTFAESAQTIIGYIIKQKKSIETQIAQNQVEIKYDLLEPTDEIRCIGHGALKEKAAADLGLPTRYETVNTIIDQYNFCEI